MSLQILVQIRVREILSQNVWLLPRPISDAYIQYIVKPDTQILHHYYSYAYVHYCKKNNFFSSLSETIKHLLCPQVFWGGDPFAAVGMSVQCENAPTALSFEWFSYM